MSTALRKAFYFLCKQLLPGHSLRHNAGLCAARRLDSRNGRLQRYITYKVPSKNSKALRRYRCERGATAVEMTRDGSKLPR